MTEIFSSCGTVKRKYWVREDCRTCKGTGFFVWENLILDCPECQAWALGIYIQAFIKEKAENAKLRERLTEDGNEAEPLPDIPEDKIVTKSIYRWL